MLGNIGAGVASQSVEVLANGDVLVSISETAPGAAGYAVRCYLIDTIASTPYTGDGVSGAFVLAANHTNTAYPVPLTVAQGTAGTVGNHSCTALLSSLGITLGDEFSVYATYRLANLTAGYQPLVFSISNGTFNESIYLNAAQDFASRPSNIAVVDGGVGQSTQAGFGPNASVGARRRMAARIKTNDIRPAWDGVLGVADTSATLPTVDRVFLGLNWQGSGGNIFQGHVEDIAIVPRAGLSDAQLQALSTL